MKKISYVLLVLLGTSTTVLANQGTLCSPINYCRVEKKTWGKGGWISNYLKETETFNLCESDRPTLQLEPELGIELWLFKGDKASMNWLESKPHVTVNLYTYKLTYIVASGSALLNDSTILFSHRLTPKGKTFVEVACFKK